MSQSKQTILDALVVGAGFSGVSQLYNLRALGFNVKACETGASFGGAWYWNAYPGARVDSDFSYYQLTMAGVWKGFTFSERFPGREEIKRYFDYVDETLQLSKDIMFNTRVESAVFDDSKNLWQVTVVTTAPGAPPTTDVITTRFFIICAGFASIPAYPNYKGLSTFAGEAFHTARWPQVNSSAEERFGGKRVGVLGTGATGVQISQYAVPVATGVTIFHRTPQFAIPMFQAKLTKEMQDEMKRELPGGIVADKASKGPVIDPSVADSTSVYASLLRHRNHTFTGSHFDVMPRSIKSVSAEERLLIFEELWNKGGFHYFNANFQDFFSDRHANDLIYDFWRRKIHERVHDPAVAEILAPAYIDYAVGAKRFPCLEQTYYENFNNPKVKLVDLKKTQISEITPRGIKMDDGTEHELDVLVLATGFGHITSGIRAIDIRGKKGGRSIAEKWEQEGVQTQLGMTTHGYPNMFFVFGPHSPGVFSHGPTSIELQTAWVTQCIKDMRTKGHTRIEATKDSESKWHGVIQDMYKNLLWGKPTPSGQVGTSLNFTGGVPAYDQLCRDCEASGYPGFAFS